MPEKHRFLTRIHVVCGSQRPALMFYEQNLLSVFVLGSLCVQLLPFIIPETVKVYILFPFVTVYAIDISDGSSLH